MRSPAEWHAVGPLRFGAVAALGSQLGSHAAPEHVDRGTLRVDGMVVANVVLHVTVERHASPSVSCG
jgi:hypothetical protein